VAGALVKRSAEKNATQAQTQATDQALAFERENELRRRQEYDQSQAEARAQWDAEQARKAPYREMGDAILRRRAERLGIPFSPRAEPMAPAPRPSLGSLALPGGAPTDATSSAQGGTSLGGLIRSTSNDVASLRRRYPQQIAPYQGY
jgi:hypothetical protein